MRFPLVFILGIGSSAFSQQAISPILERVRDNCNGTYTGFFGYLNRNTDTVKIPVGPKNRFTGLIDRGQPVEFLPGRQKEVFVVDFTPPHIVWSLAYPTNRTAIAGSDKASNNCQDSPLPPDPGEAGKATLQGIDSDHDGVRDDIQRWIYFKFRTEPKKQMAWRQFAQDYQSNLLAYDNKSEAINTGHRTLNTLQCIQYVYDGSIDSSESHYGQFRGEFLNTPARSNAYLKSNDHFSGQVYGLPDDNTTHCRFEH